MNERRTFRVDRIEDLAPDTSRRNKYRVIFPVPQFREQVVITDGQRTISGEAAVRITGNGEQIEVWVYE